MTTLTETSTRAGGMTKDEKFVIFASSLGTVFEWYDFYLYATLAPFFAALFFPPGNDTAALLSAFATYASGFLTIMKPVGLGFVAIDMALATEDNQPPGNRHADPPHHHREH